MLTVNSLPRKQ